MIFNILDNTTELWMTKYIIGEIFCSGRATLYKNPSDQTVMYASKYLELTRHISAFHFRLSGLREAQRILERLDLKNRLASQIRMQLKAVK